jgi:hypothetical protein
MQNILRFLANYYYKDINNEGGVQYLSFYMTEFL